MKYLLTQYRQLRKQQFTYEYFLPYFIVFYTIISYTPISYFLVTYIKPATKNNNPSPTCQFTLSTKSTIFITIFLNSCSQSKPLSNPLILIKLLVRVTKSIKAQLSTSLLLSFHKKFTLMYYIIGCCLIGLFFNSSRFYPMYVLMPSTDQGVGGFFKFAYIFLCAFLFLLSSSPILLVKSSLWVLKYFYRCLCLISVANVSFFLAAPSNIVIYNEQYNVEFKYNFIIQWYPFHNNNFKSRSLMPKIRKQPKRTTKKLRIPSIKNPFLQDQPYLPFPIATNLRGVDRIILRHLDDLICEPEETPEINIDMMKEAISQQQIKLNYLKEVQENKMRKIQTETEVCKLRQQKLQQISSNQLLQCPVQVNNLGWMLQEKESIDFFN